MAAISSISTRYQSLDLWRGVICLFVVLEHATVSLWNGSKGHPGVEGWLRRAMVAPFETNLGTPLFFVISGYCIAASVVSSRRRGLTASHFLAKRLWRVFPPYWAALLLFAATITALDAVGLSRWHRGPFSLELPSVRDLDLWRWFGNLTLTETWRPKLGGPEILVFTRVAWSLCYQEQFYLVCFLALMATRTALFRTLGIATIAIVAVRIAAIDTGRSPQIEGTFVYLWHQFAIGLAAYWYINGSPSERAGRGVLAILSAVFAWATWAADITTAGSAAFGLMIIGLRRWDAAWTRIRSLDALRALGRCSYSIYLIHLPVIVVLSSILADLGVTSYWARALVMVPATTVVSTAVGVAFYHLVDRRFLELPSRRVATEVTAPRELGVRHAAARQAGLGIPSLG